GFVLPFDFTPDGFPYEFDVAVTGGTGRYAGATGLIVLSGFFGIGAATINGTASGSISYGSIPTAVTDCQRGGWRHLIDTTGRPFPNQGSCIASVEHHQQAA